MDIRGARVLIIDDTPANLAVLQRELEGAGLNVLVAKDGDTGLRIATNAAPDLILLDVIMPGMDGLETCRRLKAKPGTRDIPVIFLTVRDAAADVVRGFAAGGVDHVAKPFRWEEVLVRIRTHLEKARMTQSLREKNRELETEIARRAALTSERNQLAGRLSLISQREAERWGIDGLVGRSPTIRRIVEEIDLLHQTPATPVLIAGESGTGKELIARALHYEGPRADGPFVPVNCAAVPAELAESVFFGHRRGAFTGAEAHRIGCFELANGGTLFLDEIGAMSLDLQPKLLRVLEDGRFLPVGDVEERLTDVRVVAATNSDLPTAIDAGRFRQDLYYRLARFVVQVPPLRERKDDLPLLIQHFLTLFAGEMNLRPPAIRVSAREALERYDFPGNVRELKNIIERALMQSRGEDIRLEHLQFTRVESPEPPAEASPTLPTPEDATAVPLNLDAATRLVVERALERTHGNVAAAARLLGTSRTRIYRVMKGTDGRR